MNNVCDLCGREGLDDDGYTDCDIAPYDPLRVALLCHDCLQRYDEMNDPDICGVPDCRKPSAFRVVDYEGSMFFQCEDHHDPSVFH